MVTAPTRHPYDDVSSPSGAEITRVMIDERFSAIRGGEEKQ